MVEATQLGALAKIVWDESEAKINTSTSPMCLTADKALGRVCLWSVIAFAGAKPRRVGVVVTDCYRVLLGFSGGQREY